MDQNKTAIIVVAVVAIVALFFIVLSPENSVSQKKILTGQANKATVSEPTSSPVECPPMKDEVCEFYGDVDGSTLTEAYFGAKGACEARRYDCIFTQQQENNLNNVKCEYTLQNDRTGCEFRSNLVAEEWCKLAVCVEYTGTQQCNYDKVDDTTGQVKFIGYGRCFPNDLDPPHFSCLFTGNSGDSGIVDWDAYGCERPYEENSG